MPQTLFDADGNEVEVPSTDEVTAMKEASEDLKTQLEAMGEGSSEGMKSLRDAIKRRDSKITSLEEKIVTPVATEKTEEEKATEAEAVKAESTKKTKKDEGPTVQEAVRSELIASKIRGDLANLTAEEREAVTSAYTKLTAGEEVNLETYNSFLDSAKGAVLPDAASHVSSGVTHGGRPARVGESEKSFADTDQGKAFAGKLGISVGEEKK